MMRTFSVRNATVARRILKRGISEVDAFVLAEELSKQSEVALMVWNDESEEIEAIFYRGERVAGSEPKNER